MRTKSLKKISKNIITSISTGMTEFCYEPLNELSLQNISSPIRTETMLIIKLFNARWIVYTLAASWRNFLTLLAEWQNNALRNRPQKWNSQLPAERADEKQIAEERQQSQANERNRYHHKKRNRYIDLVIEGAGRQGSSVQIVIVILLTTQKYTYI